MLAFLDNILRDLLLTEVSSLSSEDQVRFQPPDEEWRSYVSTLTVDGQPALALNVYLTDLRENRTLRSNERTREISNGQITHTPAPARVDCHYLISAWSPATATMAVEPTLDEHTLLYDALAVLMNATPINPSRVYPVDSTALAAVPELIREEDLPTAILPVEGFSKLPEFWSAMGEGHRWKPALYLTVTLPVAMEDESAVPMVTSRVVEYRKMGQAGAGEVLVQIAGHVLNAFEEPVAGAWVRLENTAGEGLQTAETDEQGRFDFDGLAPGSYQLNWRAVGYAIPPAPRPIEVPAPEGEYDLMLPS